ncbi:MAG: class I SAM-dependent methyltransferase [Hyphomicrobiales bacterium]
MITPNKTLQFYAENARQYAERPPDKSFINRRNTFAAHFEQGKHVLELGCGAGHDALAFIKLGLSVTLVDGSLELAAIAQECTGQEVLVMDFRELAFEKQLMVSGRRLHCCMFLRPPCLMFSIVSRGRCDLVVISPLVLKNPKLTGEMNSVENSAQ